MTALIGLVDCTSCRFSEYNGYLVVCTKASSYLDSTIYLRLVACWDRGPRSWELPLEELEIRFYG